MFELLFSIILHLVAPNFTVSNR